MWFVPPIMRCELHRNSFREGGGFAMIRNAHSPGSSEIESSGFRVCLSEDKSLSDLGRFGLASADEFLSAIQPHRSRSCNVIISLFLAGQGIGSVITGLLSGGLAVTEVGVHR